MAGRAGRRGLDSVGTVIIAAWDNFPAEATCRTLLSGRATKLESQFRLTYGMILNLMRVEDLRVEDMLARSFAELHAQRSVGDRKGALALDAAALRRVEELAAEEEAADPAGWAAATAHERACARVRAAADVRAAVLTSKGGQAAMVPGRVLLIAGGGEERGGDTQRDGVVTAEDGGVGGGGFGGGVDKHGALLRVVNVPGGAGRGGTSADEAATKTYVLLFPCPEGHPPPTEEEKAAADAAAAAASDEAKLRPSAAEPTTLARKGARGGDDDDMFGLGGFGKKGGRRGGVLGGTSGGGGSGNFGGDDRVEGPMPPGLPWRLSSGGSDYLVAAVPAERVLAVTDARIAVEPSAVLTPPSSATGSKSVLGSFPRATPSPVAAAASSRALSDFSRALARARARASLDPVRDLKLGDVAAVEACHELARLVAEVPPLPPSVAPRLRAWNALLNARRTLGGSRRASRARFVGREPAADARFRKRASPCCRRWGISTPIAPSRSRDASRAKSRRETSSWARRSYSRECWRRFRGGGCGVACGVGVSGEKRVTAGVGGVVGGGVRARARAFGVRRGGGAGRRGVTRRAGRVRRRRAQVRTHRGGAPVGKGDQVCGHLSVHGRAEGFDRANHRATGRDVPGRAQRRENHGRLGAVREDGGCLGRHQEGHMFSASLYVAGTS